MNNNLLKNRVLIGMSGGVDSSTAVCLLRDKGYEVFGAFCIMHDYYEEALKDAKKVAEDLDVELFVLDVRSDFKDIVISNFLNCYKSGETPNPCIVCNPNVKFKALVEKANEIGAKYIATGHYARISSDNGRYFIKAAENKAKDQSYMLYRLSQDILERTIFPLGEYCKEDVRILAEKNNINVASKPDSQEICFIPDNDYVKFIENRLGSFPKGKFISPEGNVCGEHKGIINYTVGQRKGLNISLGQPVFITKIDPLKNEIYLAYKGGEYFHEVIFDDVVFMKLMKIDGDISCNAKVRYSTKTEKCVVQKQDDRTYRAYFKDKVRAPAKGQSVVFYDDEDNVLFGGFIK